MSVRDAHQPGAHQTNENKFAASAAQRRIESSRTRIQRKWDRGERGAALVEAAIIFLPLCLVVFGIIEYGFVFKDSLTISSATRAGARTASAEAKATTFYEDTVAAVSLNATGLTFSGGEKLWIYKAKSDGLPQSGSLNVCSAFCTEYVYDMGSKSFKLNGPAPKWKPEQQNACLGTADSVGVLLKIEHDALSGFFHDLKLQERSVMRLEPLGTDCA